MMAANKKSFVQLSLVFAVAAGIFVGSFATPAATAQSAPAAYPVPMNANLVGDGIAPLAINACSASIATTSGNQYGDGCPSTGGLLSSPQGVAVDSYGNVYISDYSDRLVRVVYNGGAAVAALITAANSGYAISATRNGPAPTPVVGDVYTIAGVGGSTLAALTVTNGSGQFYCANYAATGQPVALDNLGDGCPGAAAPIGPRDVAVDAAGNLFITDYTDSRIRVLCVACTSTSLAAKLITLENPGVTPANGAIYTVAGFSVGYRDGPGFAGATSATSTVALLRSPTQAVMSSSDDVFIADNINNAVRVLYNGGPTTAAILAAEGYTGTTAPVVGNVYTIVGANCTQAPATTNGSATTYECIGTIPGSGYTEETISVGNNTATGVVWSLYLDANNNLFYSNYLSVTVADNRIKVLYGGVAPPLTFPNATYPNTLKVGYAYSFAGQGTLTQSGVPPSQLALTAAQSISGDANGNLFFFDYATGLLYETYAQNGLTAIIAGGNAVTTPVANAYCSGGTTGPQMTDAYYNGCPATQVKFSSPRGPVAADSNGNLYFGDSVGYFVRKFAYNPTFPTTAVGATSASQPYAFTFASAQTLATPVLTQSPDFTDAGNDTCTSGLVVAGGAPGTTCVENVKFTPTLAGLRTNALVMHSATAALGGALMSGTATGSGLAVDPGTSTTNGSSYAPNGIAVDDTAHVYFTDTVSKSVIRYSGSATTIATGFTVPTGVAVDAAGNVFVADSSANTITEVPITGTKFVLSSAVSNPHGLATDGAGRLYVADTGNNRVLVFGPGAITPTVAAFTGLSAPQAVAVDYAGNLYALDSTHAVKLTPAGVQTTVAPSGGTGLAVDAAGNVLVTTGLTLLEFPASASTTAVTLSSSLNTPKGLALDGAGNAYIADNGFAGYLELQRTAGYYKFLTNPASTAVELTSIGTATVASTAYTQTDSVDYTLTPATTNGCSGALPSGSECGINAAFNPKSAGIVTDNVTFTPPISNGVPTLTLTTVSLVPAISVQAIPTTLTYGTSETLTATIYGPSNTSGTVIFYAGTTQIASVAATSSATAAYTYTPAVGVYSITATFTPTGSTTPTVTSTPVTVTVKQATPTIGVTLSASSGYTTTSVLITATLGTSYGSPTGTISFYAGTTALGSVAVASGTGSLTVTNLPVGTDCITAVYSGDSNYATITSSCSTIVVAPGFGVIPATTSLAFQVNYQEAQAYLTVNPGGTAYTLTFACNGLPAKLGCAFSPASLPLTGVSTVQYVQMLVSNSNATAVLHSIPQRPGVSHRSITLALLPLAAVALFLGRRRRLPMLIIFGFLLGATALSGCGNVSPTSLEQAPGSYPFTVTVNNGGTALQTLSFTLTIPPN